MKKERRRKEREIAFFEFFRNDFGPQNQGSLSENFDITDEDLGEFLKGVKGKYVETLLESFNNRNLIIDDMIERRLKKPYTVEMLSPTDRAILRLAVTEMTLDENPVPKEIAINEALELTKKYGKESSKSYINGVLNGIADDLIDEDTNRNSD